jgi:tRNA-specific 2-thiouridylase
MDCNTFLKFDRVWNFLENTFGVRHLATGHYARIVDHDGVARLARADDRQKDQSYFLYGMARDRLSQLLLPLGSLSKPQVRELARRHKLPVAQRPESMELCFAGEGNYRRALDPESDGRSGPILDLSGKVIGQHTGIANYTIGQRRGLGIAAGQPMYVVRINPIENSVTIGSIAEACRRRVTAERMNILSPDQLFSGAQLYGKIRSTGEPAGCVVVRLDERVISVDFDEPVFAPTPGQHLVLYDEQGRVVAGGTLFTADEPDRGEYVSCAMGRLQG